MSPANSGEPPAKKRRFFTGPDDHVSSNTTSDSNLHDTHDSSLIETSPVSRPAERAPTPNVNHPSHPSTTPLPPPQQQQPPTDSDTDVSFDGDVFQGLVGDTVDSETLEIIRTNCGDSLGRAVNMFFDGTWRRYKKRPQTHPLMNPAIRPPPRTPRTPPATTKSSPTADPRARGHAPSETPDARYIGAFGVEGWATRSGLSLVKHGDFVNIERQKVQQTPVRMRLAAAGKSDVIVRFTDSNGTEIGRLAKDAASWISSLIDQNVCRFEGMCVYAPERLRTNDTIFLQLQCFLRMSVFQQGGLEPPDNRSTGLYEEKESTEERDLRLRQVGIVKLFQEINLAPIKTNSASSRNARQGLLDAAELAEKKSKLSRSSSRCVFTLHYVLGYILTPS